MSKTFTSRNDGVIGANVAYKPVAESTNTEATMGLAQKDGEGTVYIVDFQTKGRGQRGNYWESEERKNLTPCGVTPMRPTRMLAAESSNRC